jgi:hypothetical protein
MPREILKISVRMLLMDGECNELTSGPLQCSGLWPAIYILDVTNRHRLIS